MKRIIALFVTVCMALTVLCGCESGKSDNGKLSIVTTIFPQYDFARTIGGEFAEVTMLVSPGGESHSFEATLSDMAKVENCDLFIYVGGESDKWVDTLFDSMGENNIKKIALTDIARPVEEQHVNGAEQEDEEHDHEETEYDEHVWTSVRNCMKFVNSICGALCQLDPENEQYFKQNASALLDDLVELDVAFEEAVANGSRKTLVFADRFPFYYFARDYGLECYAALDGCSSNTEPSLSTISGLTDRVKQDAIPAVFYIEFSSQKVADTICNATGAKKLLFHSCHNVTQEDFDGGITYVGLMRRNAENLREALS